MTVWTTGNSLGTARSNVSGCGSSAAGFVTGGSTGATAFASTEELNALAWSAGGAMSTARYGHACFGSQSSSVVAMGSTTSGVLLNSTEKYDGTSFSSSGAAWFFGLLRGCGSQSAGLICGGTAGGGASGAQNLTGKFNGSAWSTSGNMVSARDAHAVAGSQSAAFECGGENTSSTIQSTSNNFNGSTWASSGALPASGVLAAAFGTQTAGRACGGINSSYATVATTYLYNGSTWSTGNSLNTARYGLSDGSGVAAGGTSSSGSDSAVSEIYGDRIPSAFGFTDVVDANLSTVTTSDTVTPTGYDVTTSWTVTGGEASVAGGAWATSGAINPGQNIQLRATSSASYATAVSATLTIGGVSDTWYVTTKNAPIQQIIFL